MKTLVAHDANPHQHPPPRSDGWPSRISPGAIGERRLVAPLLRTQRPAVDLGEAADLDADCRLLTIAQAAKLLGCSRATAYRLLGKPSPPITPTRVGEELRFPAQRVLAFTHALP